jgi:hypothetical protein
MESGFFCPAIFKKRTASFSSLRLFAGVFRPLERISKTSLAISVAISITDSGISFPSSMRSPVMALNQAANLLLTLGMALAGRDKLTDGRGRKQSALNPQFRTPVAKRQGLGPRTPIST